MGWVSRHHPRPSPHPQTDVGDMIPIHPCVPGSIFQGTMEEKIYDRQVTKQSLSFRVVDQQQIERHFTTNELAELYTFEPEMLDDPSGKKRKAATPMLPKVKRARLSRFW